MPPFDRPAGSATTPAASRGDVIHLINPLWDIHGGSDWRTIEMYRALMASRRVHLWSRFTPAREFLHRYPVQLIRPWNGRFPIGGTFVFIGAYFRIGHWFKLAFPRRTILVYNTHQPDRLTKVLRRLQAWHRTPVEIVYTSSLLRSLSDHPGPVIESPIDIAHFVPRGEVQRPTRRFTVGRLSRDVGTKHHEDDPAVYSALAAAGVVTRVMGGTCLRGLVQASAASGLMPAGAEAPVDFLQGLDCFFYRTSERWLEAYGRVVFEAMACGLPVVCGRRGGYADYIVHGVNGFLFDTTAEAVTLILKLRDDVALRERVGRAARQTVERLYRGGVWRQKQAFFLRAPDTADGVMTPGENLEATPSELH
jgi:glycosyltransferase involved in cell wall biosynthesis